jgi:hypothetical protein
MADLADEIGVLATNIRELRDRADQCERRLALLTKGVEKELAQLGPSNTIGTQAYVELIQIDSVNSGDGTWVGTPLRTDDEGFLGPSVFDITPVKGQRGAAQVDPQVGQTVAAVFTGQEAEGAASIPHHSIIGAWDTYKSKVVTDADPRFLFDNILDHGAYTPSVHATVFADIVGSGPGQQLKLFVVKGTSSSSGGGDSVVYEAGCGIDSSALAEGLIEIKIDDLMGAGLTQGEDCQLAVNNGCGLKFNSDPDKKLMVDPATMLAGTGTSQGGLKPFAAGNPDDCRIQVYKGCGLDFGPADGSGWVPLIVDVAQLVGDGLKSDPLNGPTHGCKLQVKTGCGLTIDGTNQSVKIDLDAIAGTLLTVDHGGSCPTLNVSIGVGCGLDTDGENIYITASDIAGNGLSSPDDCVINVNVGCGLEIVADQIRVKASDLAGAGLVAGGPCTLGVVVGCGLKIDTAASAPQPIVVNPTDLAGCGLKPRSSSSGDCALSIKRTDLMGPGLTADNSNDCKMKLDLGCGLQFDSNQVKVKLDPAGNITCTGSGLAAVVGAGTLKRARVTTEIPAATDFTNPGAGSGEAVIIAVDGTETVAGYDLF